MKPPVHRMKKIDIIKLAKWRCRHGVSGLEHYNCWLRDHPGTEKIGFLDIEATNLKADFGIVISYAICDDATDEIIARTITKSELRTCLDKKIVEECIKNMRKFDRLVTYFGTRFDTKFLRTRALSLGLEFPEYGELIHTDIYYTCLGKLSLSSYRLDNACRALFGETVKTRIAGDFWIKALMGDKKALAYIQDHNIKDVIELKRLYHALNPYRKTVDNTL